MKNLKDYFSSPKSSDEQTTVNLDISLQNESNSKKKAKSSKSNENKCSTKKSKKRKLSEAVETPENGLNSDVSDEGVIKKKSLKLKKRKTDTDKKEIVSNKKKRSSTPAGNVSEPNLNDNFVNGKTESPACSGVLPQTKKTSSNKDESLECAPSSPLSDGEIDSSPSDGKISLLKYFNKVEKTYLKNEPKITIKVEALVHTPPASKKKSIPSDKPKRKVKKRRDISAEFDLITSEEESFSMESCETDNSSQNTTPWKMRISLGAPLKAPGDILEEDVLSSDDSKKMEESETDDVNGGVTDSASCTESENHPSNDKIKESTSASSSQSSDILPKKSTFGKFISEEEDSVISVGDSPIENPVNSSNNKFISEEEDSVISVGDSPIDNPVNSSNNDVILVEEDSIVSVVDVKNHVNLIKSNIGSSSTSPFNRMESSKQPEKKLKGGTLASYFGLKVQPVENGKKNKSSLSKEQIEAKQQFLESGVPDTVKKMIKQSKSEEVEGCTAPFPAISHVRQKDKFSMMWNLSEKNIVKTPLVEFPPRVPPWSGGFISPDVGIIQDAVLQNDKKVTLKDLKEQEKDLPIKAWHKGLTSMKKVSNTCEMWSERYRPKTCSDVLLNGAVVDKLSAWLQSRASSNNDRKDEESSSDEFVSNDADGPSRSYNTALLVGPPGTGKTAAVYAAAKHNGYQVLELNASCNRNGKKIINEFSEATQSHKVETQSLLKSKSKKKKVEPNNKSLILIEDADLVYNDIDEGFISCLSSLQTGSKRPLVLIVNDPKPKHILKLAPSGNTFVLNFERPPLRILSGFLRTLALVEGLSLSEEASKRFVEASSFDLRRSFMMLQFYLPKNLVGFCTTSEVTSLSNDADSLEKIETSAKLSRILSNMDFMNGRNCQDWMEFCLMSESTVLDPSMDYPKQQISHELENYISSNISSQLTKISSNTHSNENLNYDKVSSCLPTVNQLSRKIISMDYFPTIRTIARSEKTRLATHTKRNNRFFNYLNNSGLPTEPDLLDFLCESLVT